jgi:hypothetical protein
MDSQKVTWSQMNPLPDDILEDSIVVDASWNMLEKMFFPENNSFYPSKAWFLALDAFGVPSNEVNLGISPGVLHEFLKSCDLRKIEDGKKMDHLLVQVCSGIKDRMAKVGNPTGEAFCSFHFKVISQYQPVEGTVILMKNVTILPDCIINLTLDNVLRVFN